MQTVNKDQQLIFSHHDWPQIISPPSSISKLSRSGVFLKIELILHEWFWYTSDMKKIFPFNKICQLMKRKSSFMMSLWPMDSYFRILFKYPLTWNEGLKFYPAFKCKIPFNKFTQNLSPTPPHIMRGVFFGQGLSVGLELSPPPCFSEHMITPH